jgi:hypothetical protein
MKNVDPIERLLEQTPAPWVVEGPHREQLKQRLLEPSATAQPRREPMKISLFQRMPSLVKLAAALLGAAILIGTGWTSEKIYRLVSGESPAIMHRDPSGTTRSFGTGGPNPAAAERQADEEIKQLVAQKKYKFVRRIDHADGSTSYVYYFQLSNHARLKWKYPGPRLEDVASWDEYQRKSAEYGKQREKDIAKAIASGKGRLINFVLEEIHVCRDVATGQKLDVVRAAPDCPEEGKVDFAYIYNGGMQEYEKPGDHMLASSSWPDHLKAIREGQRELLDVRIVKKGIYEAVRADGSKFVFPRELPPTEKPATK